MKRDDVSKGGAAETVSVGSGLKVKLPTRKIYLEGDY
jgi:hypothetical protein